MSPLCTKLSQFCNTVSDLNTKINLFTLTIRDEEMKKQYEKAREQYYWLTIFVVEFLREVTMILTIFAGFFEDRNFWVSYIGRVFLYIILAILYKASKKNPRVKDFIPVAVIIMYNVLFIMNP